MGFPFFIFSLKLCMSPFYDSHAKTSMNWYLIAVWLAFLLISDIKHFFMYLMAICMSSLEKYLFRTSAHFKWDCFIFAMDSCELWVMWVIELHIEYQPFMKHDLKIFSLNSTGFPFILLIVSFSRHKLFN